MKTIPIRFEAVLGAIFIAAAWPKIQEPPDFAHMICNYKIIPGSLVNLLGIYLPWLEAITGVALILGVLRRASLLAIGGMLIVFIVALGINLARDHAVDCGCFDLHPVEKTDEELFADMKMTILRDVGMLVMVGVAFLGMRGEQKKTATSPEGNAAA